MIPSMAVHVFKKTGKGFGSRAKVVNLKGTVTEDSSCKNSSMGMTTPPQKSAESKGGGGGGGVQRRICLYGGDRCTKCIAA
jgi:hypothetical protein